MVLDSAVPCGDRGGGPSGAAGTLPRVDRRGHRHRGPRAVQINQLERDNIPDFKSDNGLPVEYEHIP
jgi:hypothetical protein